MTTANTLELRATDAKRFSRSHKPVYRQSPRSSWNSQNAPPRSASRIGKPSLFGIRCHDTANRLIADTILSRSELRVAENAPLNSGANAWAASNRLRSAADQ